MASKKLLCVELDDSVLATIRTALEPLDFEITNITNGDEAVAWGRTNRPALAIVSVEPRKVGYAICNKFKRNAEMKGIPLILTSAEETPQQLEQHRKLKVKANEYLSKPFSLTELLTKVQAVLPLDGESRADKTEPGGESEDLIMEEISIDDVDIVEDEDGETDAIDAGGFGTPVPTTATSSASLASEAEAALDAIRADHDAPQADADEHSGNSEGQAAPWDVDDEEWEAVATAATNIEEIAGAGDKLPELPENPIPSEAGLVPPEADGRFAIHEAATRMVSDGAEIVNLSVPSTDDDGAASTRDDAPSLAEDDDAFTARSPSVPPPPPPPRRITSQMDLADDNEDAAPVVEAHPSDDLPDPSELAVPRTGEGIPALSARDESDLLAQIEELQAEVERLKTRPPSTASARDKDMLALREVINKKERDLLDLRDELDGKERQILDHKDRLREHERERRNLEEKLLGFEKDLLAANERIEALQQDKEKASTREQTLKSRLEDAHNEITKTHEEIAALKKHTADNEEHLRAEADRLRGTLEARILEMEDSHRTELGQIKESHAAALGAAEDRLRSELKQRDDALDETSLRLSSIQSDLDAARAELQSRDGKLGQANDRIVELEARVIDAEEQIMRAYQRMKNDEHVITRAKSSLAVALALLEERDADASDKGAGATAENERHEGANDDTTEETTS